ncbi:MAG: AraC family transcriptional regulator [Pseudobutyrivibrio sp.]|nr:AraC family transcriptional regulator [Pseudobutyrivibrio sp.]
MNTKETKESINFDSIPIVSISEENSPSNFPAHWHNALEFTIALRDSCRYLVNDVPYTLNRGDVLLIWPRELHEIVHVPHSGSLFIQFPSSIVENNLDLFSIVRFYSDYHHISSTKQPELAKYIFDKIWEIRQLLIENDYFVETRCKQCIYDILLKIGEQVMLKQDHGATDASFNKSAWRYINSACTYITENSTDSITQADVSKHVGLSSYYFSKLFKQYLQMSFPAYLSRIRVRNAINLLLDENLTITECAFQAGFQSTTSFNKVFHDITGHSPREYRKLHNATPTSN